MTCTQGTTIDPVFHNYPVQMSSLSEALYQLKPAPKLTLLPGFWTDLWCSRVCVGCAGWQQWQAFLAEQWVARLASGVWHHEEMAQCAPGAASQSAATCACVPWQEQSMQKVFFFFPCFSLPLETRILVLSFLPCSAKAKLVPLQHSAVWVVLTWPWLNPWLYLAWPWLFGDHLLSVLSSKTVPLCRSQRNRAPIKYLCGDIVVWVEPRECVGHCNCILGFLSDR